MAIHLKRTVAVESFIMDSRKAFLPFRSLISLSFCSIYFELNAVNSNGLFEWTNVRIFSFGRWKREENVSETVSLFGKYGYFCRRERRKNMSYSEMAQLELMNAINSIRSEAELNEFKDLVARYFAAKAQKAIDALWDEGIINKETIEQWGDEHMRTPYRYAAHRS